MDKDIFKKLFTNYYWIKRSQEFTNAHDSEQTWNTIQYKITKKRRMITLRNSAITTSVAAAIAVVSFLVFKPSSSEMYNKITPMSQISSSVVLITGDNKMYDLQAKTSITNDNTHLVYDSVGVRVVSNEMANPNEIQTISVPFAKRYRVILPDSTVVWLNSDTKLSFTQSFTNVRAVKLIGEAYFEVKKDTERPFLIHIGSSSISVLGTSFTVTNYKDLPVSTTLIEGSVEIASAAQHQILVPNQRAEIDPKGNISIATVDAVQATSWISGVYEFDNKSLEYVTSYISRMYGVVIRIDNDELRKRYMTGVINSNEDIGYSLNLIKKVLSVKITLVDNEIVIQ